MEKLRLAACGIDCSECASYKVTINHDLQAAESLVEWYKEQGWVRENEGVDAVMKKAPICKGCWNITDDCFWKCGCGSLDFRICCTERSINHCGECYDFPCESYKQWATWHESHKEAMQCFLSLRKTKNDDL